MVSQPVRERVGKERSKMIRAVMVMNTQGKPRLSKFYDFMVKQPVEKQQELLRSVYGVLCSRAEDVSNFVQCNSIFGPDTRLVYKHFATLYFVFIFDSSENELAMLDLIQVFVETLDKCFKNVCELDIVFNFSKIHTVLNEIVFGGQVLETSSTEVMKAVEEIASEYDLHVEVMILTNQHKMLLHIGEGVKCNLTSPEVCFALAKSIVGVISSLLPNFSSPFESI